MRQLTSPSVPFNVEDKCRAELTDNIQGLKELPKLYPFDPDKPIYLIYDGSRSGIGWVWLNLYKSDAGHLVSEETVLSDLRKAKSRACLRPFAYGD